MHSFLPATDFREFDDPDSLRTVLCISCALLVFAALLYLVTSARERPGFRLVPETRREWDHYAWRTVILGAMGLIAAVFGPASSTLPPSIFALIALLAGALLFRRENPAFGIVALLVLLFIVLSMLVPMIR